MSHPGKLVYLMGPSGSGKDSLLAAVQKKCAGVPTIVFPRRHITRSAEAGGEDHISVSKSEFDRLEQEGHFALSWRSHGFSYGITKDISVDLAQGRIVVINGSREYFPEALRRYPDLVPVLVTVDPAVLKDRLQARGRENGCEIEERLSRNVSLESTSAQIVIIDNSGRLEDSGEDFLQLLVSIAC